MGKFEDLINAFMELRRSSEYDASQARADDGKWTDGGGGGGSQKKKVAKPKGSEVHQPIEAVSHAEKVISNQPTISDRDKDVIKSMAQTADTYVKVLRAKYPDLDDAHVQKINGIAKKYIDDRVHGIKGPTVSEPGGTEYGLAGLINATDAAGLTTDDKTFLMMGGSDVDKTIAKMKKKWKSGEPLIKRSEPKEIKPTAWDSFKH